MADCITALITQNIVAAITSVTTENGYDTNIEYCSQERISDRRDDRYPRVEIAGPALDIDQGTHTQGDQYDLEYTLFYYNPINDDSFDDEPAPMQTQNVVADLIKGLMVDHTRGGYAIMTRPAEAFYTIEYTNDGGPVFVVALTVNVTAIIDSFNPYSLG